LLVRDARRAKAVAEEARQQYFAVGNRLGAAKATLIVGDAHTELGELELSIAAFRDVEVEARAAGNLLLAANARNNRGNSVAELGHLDEAIHLFDESVALYEQLNGGPYNIDRNIVETLINAASVANAAGRLETARRYDERALSAARNAHDRASEQEALMALAEARAKLGAMNAAVELATQAEAINRERGDRFREPDAESSLGIWLYHAGRLDAAEAAFARGLAIGADESRPAPRGLCALGLSLVARARHDLTTARQRLTEARALVEEQHWNNGVAMVQIAAAHLSVDEGHYTEAIDTARAAAAALARLNVPADQSDAERVRAEALLGLHDVAGARAALAEAQRLHPAQDRLGGWDLAITAARVLAAGGDVPGALRALTLVVATAERAGIVPLALEAAARRADLERALGRPAARAHLESLRRRANAAGFRIIADSVKPPPGKRAARREERNAS
jgi:tetratricopeptide (TPR) repeat protein